METSNPSKHDLRISQLESFAAHLRAIHLSLFITSIILILGATAGTREHVQNALSELRDIRVALNALSEGATPPDQTRSWNSKWLSEKIYQENELTSHIRSLDNFSFPTKFKFWPPE